MATPARHARAARSACAWRAGDAWGGLAAAAVLLPQAMAFGVALYAIAGLDAASGAAAGLTGTALICVASGAFGGARGLISAPTGPTLVLLGGAAGGLVAAGYTDGRLLLGLAATTVAAGVLQFFIGISGGGRLIKYIPFPVVSGFMTGSAILMILSQRGPLSGGTPGAAWEGWTWLPGTAALVTITGAVAAGRWLPRVPGPIAGLVAGTLAFHGLAALNGAPLPADWLIGAVPGLEPPGYALGNGAPATLPLDVILPAAAALAVLASLDTLLTAVVADVATGERHDARREMMGQGCGQVLAGLAGGMAGAGTTGATVVAIRSGGRRWVGVATGIVFVLLILLGGDIGRALPIGALAGVILYVAFGLADRDILAWAKRGRTRTDAGIAIVVTLVTVFYDLMIAVALGVVIAAALFIREQIRAPVVHRRSTGVQMRSVRNRPLRERETLEHNGERIVVYDLRGNLFFGTADRLIDELGADLDGPNWLVLHLRKVTRIDLTALKLLRQIAERLHAHGGTLVCCEVHQGAGIGGDMAAALREAGEGALLANVLTFNGRDEALEFAEDALLDALDCPRTAVGDSVPSGSNGIARYMSVGDKAVLDGALAPIALQRGEVLFRAGAPGADLYLVVSGEIEVRIPTTEHHHKRLASYGPGTFFGELALLREGSRAADALALSPSRLLALSRGDYVRITREHPATAIALLGAICDVLVTNQRWSTREMQRLSEW